MFLAREKELTALNKLWNSDRFEMVVIYGRRRVGKTALINEFCIDKKAIIHISTEFSMQLNLESFSKEATYCIYKNASLFSSFEELFEFLYKIALDERIIIAIDEYPYLAKAYPEISSLLQKYIDSKFKDTLLMLILCGSSMSFMENQVLGYQSPLYGRRTAQMKILPFDYRETALMFPHYTYEEKAIAYGITGGIPLYAQILTRHRTLKEALLDEVFNTNGFLFEEPSNLLKQELREPSTYNSILHAIVSGASRLNEIAGKVHMETGLCTRYLNKLQELGIVKKEHPIGIPKKSIYLISDPMFRFWFKFVPDYMGLINSGRINETYDELIEKQFHSYMGLIYEEICRQFLLKYTSDQPFIIPTIGQWWGNDPILKKEAQIDVFAYSADLQKCLLGECKFTTKPINLEIYQSLVQTGEHCFSSLEKYYYLFSLSGFTKDLSTLSSVKMYSLEDLYK